MSTSHNQRMARREICGRDQACHTGVTGYLGRVLLPVCGDIESSGKYEVLKLLLKHQKNKYEVF